MKKIISAMALSLLMGMASATAQEIKPFVEGERAAFLGNSIRWRTLSLLYLAVLHDTFPEYAYQRV